jgi:hypothetical protein
VRIRFVAAPLDIREGGVDLPTVFLQSNKEEGINFAAETQFCAC